MKIAIVGRGRVGRGLFAALGGKDGPAQLISGRAPPPPALADADAVVLAVPDDAIAETAARIASAIRPGAAVVHCAGARDASELDACKRAGADVGVMHPMVSFPSTKKPPSLAAAALVASGGRRAIAAARFIAARTGATLVIADVHGPAYHAAAALAANGSAALATVSVSVLERLGMKRRDAQRAIAGLLRTVADNVARIGVPEALTGPVRRGDAETVRGHLEALGHLDAEALRAYGAVGPIILSCARAAGLDPRAARKVGEVLSRWTARSDGK